MLTVKNKFDVLLQTSKIHTLMKNMKTLEAEPSACQTNQEPNVKFHGRQ